MPPKSYSPRLPFFSPSFRPRPSLSALLLDSPSLANLPQPGKVQFFDKNSLPPTTAPPSASKSAQKQVSSPFPRLPTSPVRQLTPCHSCRPPSQVRARSKRTQLSSRPDGPPSATRLVVKSLPIRFGQPLPVGRSCGQSTLNSSAALLHLTNPSLTISHASPPSYRATDLNKPSSARAEDPTPDVQLSYLLGGSEEGLVAPPEARLPSRSFSLSSLSYAPLPRQVSPSAMAPSLFKRNRDKQRESFFSRQLVASLTPRTSPSSRSRLPNHLLPPPSTTVHRAAPPPLNPRSFPSRSLPFRRAGTPIFNRSIHPLRLPALAACGTA